MKKITFYLIVFAFAVFAKTTAQNNYRFDGNYNGVRNFGIEPVYYNYSSRQLFYNNMPMNGNLFLGRCRFINDKHVQQQIERYDQLTRKKKTLVALTIASGVGGYLMAVSSLNRAMYGGGAAQTSVATVGVLGLLACPILAISTAIPHQKRKEVVFRDLPAAYNFYVENQTKK